MNSLAALFVGLLAGWLLEWFIDWLYWRRKNARLNTELAQCCTRLDTITKENEELHTKLDTQEKVSEVVSAEQKAKKTKVVKSAKPDKPAKKVKKVPDDLKKIKGIGKKIEKLLNDNSITTYAELSEISADELQDLLGDKVKRLADEDDIIQQAGKLAKKGS